MALAIAGGEVLYADMGHFGRPREPCGLRGLCRLPPLFLLAPVSPAAKITAIRPPGNAQTVVTIARQVAAEVAVATLGEWRAAYGREAPVGDTAQVQALAQNRDARQNTMSADGSMTERGAARPPHVGAIGATEALVWRQPALVRDDRSEQQTAHQRTLRWGRTHSQLATTSAAKAV